MKHFLLIFGISIFSAFNIQAQITLEHTFNPGSNGNFGYFNTNEGIRFYFDGRIYNSSTEKATNQLIIYNLDFSIYKTIILPDDAVGYAHIISYVSDLLFNSDNKIEFILNKTFGGTNINSDILSSTLYDEDLNVLKDFGGSIINLITINSTSKLVVSKWDSNTNYTSFELYSLPGTLPNKIETLKQASINGAYPNPTKAIITIPYSLGSNQSTDMKIYNANGKLIEQKQIDSSFDKIMLNVNSYKSGTYIYEYNGKSNKFIVN